MAANPESLRQSLINELNLQRLDARPGTDLAYFSKAMGGFLFSVSLQARYLVDQIFPSSADEKYLLRHAAKRGIKRGEGSKALGDIDASFPVKTRLLSDAGNEYEVITSAAVSRIRSLKVGTDQNLSAGSRLKLLTPIGLVSGATANSGGIFGGTDQETIESLRQKTVNAWRQPADVGRTPDFIRWLEERKELQKFSVFPTYPLPGATSWAALVSTGPLSWDLPNAAIRDEIAAYLKAKVLPGARTAWLEEAKIVRLNLRIRTINRSEFEETLTAALKQRIFARASFFGAPEEGKTPEITESILRNIISETLGSDFELEVSPKEKLGAARLEFGETILIGEVRYE